MALYRFEASIVSRNPPNGKPRNVVQDAAYIGRERLTDDRTGDVYDYRHLGGLEFEGIFAPKGSPQWMQDRETLWNAIEEKEDHSTRPDNAQLARKFILAIPHELNAEQRRWLITDFAREMSRKGMVVDVAIHTPDEHSDERNYHAHILLTMREAGPEGFGNKVREWNKRENLLAWKERYAELGARALERAGFELEAKRFRVGHKTIKEQFRHAVERGDKEHAQYLDGRLPTPHIGPNVAAMERDGIETEKGNKHRLIEEVNKERYEARKREAAEREKGEREAPEHLKGAARDIWEAYNGSKTAQKFVRDLEDRGLHVAVIRETDLADGKVPRDSREELESLLNMQKRGMWQMASGGITELDAQQLARAKGSYEKYRDGKKLGERKMEFEAYVSYVQQASAKRLDSLQERKRMLDFADDGLHRDHTSRHPDVRGDVGTFVVLDKRGNLYQLNERTTGDSPAEAQKFMDTLDKGKFRSVADTRQLIDDLLFREYKHVVGKDRTMGGKEKATPAIERSVVRGLGVVAEAASKAFESLIIPVLTPEQKRDAERAVQEREAAAAREAERLRAQELTYERGGRDR